MLDLALPSLFEPSLLELLKGIALCESVVGCCEMNVGWLWRVRLSWPPTKHCHCASS